MNYLLDTCVISELVKPLPNRAVVGWISQTPSEELFLSVITIGEICKGIGKLGNSKRKVLLTNWINSLLDEYQSRILPIDQSVAETWGILQAKAERKGSPMASIDSLIAAVATTHNLILVTRNESDFITVEQIVFNPWTLPNR